MFRIKTDIRHYRCDSPDKVERLIRNWVIRPSDLIYDDDADKWCPIGTHQAFSELFESLEERHENQPETVVTDRAADRAASDRVRSDADESGSHSGSPHRSTVSQTGRPEPSDDVEGIVRDSDEITMMTDRTLALMSDDVAPADDDIDRAGPDEPTGRIEQPDFDDASSPDADDIAGPEEPTGRIEQPDAPSPKPVQQHRDLPEHLFVTAEADAVDDADTGGGDPDVVSSVDDSLLTSSPDGNRGWNIILDEDEYTGDQRPDKDDPPSRQPLREVDALADTDKFHRDGNEPDEDEANDVDALRDTDELDERDDSGDVDALRDTDELDERDNSDDVDAFGDTDDSPDQAPIQDVAPQDVEPLEVDEDALDDAFDDLEESAIEARETSDDDPDEPAEISVEALKEAVPDGYEAEFPIAIGPSKQSQKLGIQRSSVSTRKKDRLYSIPKRKKAGRTVRRSYRLTPHPLLDQLPLDRLPSLSQHQWMAVAAGLALLVIALGVVAC